MRDLRSSNPANPADFVAEPVAAEWPFYDNFDGTGDNTFQSIPAALTGAEWITLGRPTKPGAQTTLTFTLAPNAGPTDIFLLMTAAPGPPAPVPTGYTDTGTAGFWRDNQLDLVPYRLFCRTVSGGQTVFIPSFTQDQLVLIKQHSDIHAASGAEP